MSDFGRRCRSPWLSFLVVLVYLTGVTGDFSFLKPAPVVVSCSDHECGCGTNPDMGCCCADMMAMDEDEEESDEFYLTTCGQGKAPQSPFRILLDPHLACLSDELLQTDQPFVGGVSALPEHQGPDLSLPEKIPIIRTGSHLA